MGGECSYLLRCTEQYGLEFLPNERWMSPYMLSWQPRHVEQVLVVSGFDRLELALNPSSISLPTTAARDILTSRSLSSSYGLARMTSRSTLMRSGKAIHKMPRFHRTQQPRLVLR